MQETRTSGESDQSKGAHLACEPCLRQVGLHVPRTRRNHLTIPMPVDLRCRPETMPVTIRRTFLSHRRAHAYSVARIAIPTGIITKAGPGRTSRAIPISRTVEPTTDTMTRLTTLMLSRLQPVKKRSIENRTSSSPVPWATFQGVVARGLVGSLRATRNRSRKGTCVDFNLRLASLSEKKHARSTSGKFWYFPERGGHSNSNIFDLHSKASGKFPSNAQAYTILPPFC